jgi:arginyl-tRNA synthetase
VNKVSESEIPLIKIIEQFPSTLQDAATTYSPAVLANYLYELTKAFNSFYQQCAILNEPDEDLKMARIQIALTIQSIISRGLKILGITAPNRM